MKRNITIDLLRGLATIAMIVIHTGYYFISDKTIWFIWNWGQFAVPLFIFCAGYVYFLKANNSTIQQFNNYLLKRLSRLYMPYFIFLVFFIPVVWLTTPTKLNGTYLLESLTLIGGVDIAWLVLLMVELAIVFQIILYLKNNKPQIYKLYILIAVTFSIFTIFVPLGSLNWKLLMWLPWSLIGIAATYYLPDAKKQTRIIVWQISLITFIAIYIFFALTRHDLSFINNKYPPTLFILSYGISTIGILYWLLNKGILNFAAKFLTFISRHSYSIYFIHYCLLIFIASLLPKLHIAWFEFFLLIFLTTLSFQWIWNKLIMFITF